MDENHSVEGHPLVGRVMRNSMVASQESNENGCILENINVYKQTTSIILKIFKGTLLNLGWPFEVPPELQV